MTATQKLQQRMQQVDSLVCVGLDSDIKKLPTQLLSSATPQFEFNKMIIEATHQHVCAFKPNIAFYEARGEQGIKELKLTMEFLQSEHPEIFTICDAKRADIGSTNTGYVSEVFDWFGFDAITLHPYLGKEALQPFLERADKVSIILCRTSNPGSGELQELTFLDNQQQPLPLWLHVARKVSQEWNTHENCMLVVGATYPEDLKKVRAEVGEMTILVPGIGSQGGDLSATLKAGLTANQSGLLINSSRDIIFRSQGEDFAKIAGEAAKQLQQDIDECIALRQ